MFQYSYFSAFFLSVHSAVFCALRYLSLGTFLLPLLHSSFVMFLVPECKDRWKNIRGRYSKYKAKLLAESGQPGKRVKEYYLASHLLFLDPFMKTRGNKYNTADEVVDTPIVKEETEGSELDDDDYYETVIMSPDNSQDTCTYPLAPSPSPSTSREPKSLKVASPLSTTNEIGCRKRKSSSSITPLDPDMAFLQSVLPDIKSMNEAQKRKFKIGILKLADDILSPNTLQGDS